MKASKGPCGLMGELSKGVFKKSLKQSEPLDVTQVGHLEVGGNLPWDLANLPVVHGVEHRWVAHPFADPQLDTDAGVQEQHGHKREQKEGHHDEGGVGLPVLQWVPVLLAADMVVIVQEVIFHLGLERRETPKEGW